MSYQNRKQKKLKLNKFKYIIGLIWIKFFNKIKYKKEVGEMQFFKTRKVMEFLREKRKSLSRDVKGVRINQWVDEYLQLCLENNQKVVIITPWSWSTALIGRYKEQGNMFKPTNKEEKLFAKKIPKIMDVFEKNGFRLDWFIALGRSCLDDRLIGPKLESEYQEMITKLAKPLFKRGLEIVDLENDLFNQRIVPDEEMLKNLKKYIKPGILRREIEKWREWAQVTGYKAPVEQIDQETNYQMASMIKEGQMFMNPNFVLGQNFLLFLLESPENFFYLTIKAPELDQRMITVLPYFPWRMRAKG